MAAQLSSHQISEAIYLTRRGAHYFTEGQRLAATAALDVLAETIAEHFPPAHRDAFLAACGVPRHVAPPTCEECGGPTNDHESQCSWTSQLGRKRRA